MRILLAKLFVAITALLILFLAVLFAMLGRAPEKTPQVSQEVGPPDAGVARGRAVYVEQRCGKCHSLHGEGNKRSPLDGVGRRLTENDIRQWITAPQTMKPGIVKRAYKLSSEDLDALVEYLMKDEL